MNIIVSACLLGCRTRYNGEGVLREDIAELMKKHTLIPVCPEQLGGMSTPRDPSERIGDKVVSINGEDVTASFSRGAEEALALAKLYGCTLAILKERSPSCGCGTIYDGTFSGVTTRGNGVTAELFLKNGISVIGESQIGQLLENE